jgi:crotonobetainyl-CoA:carnitine CoA-transferase CaiB-like acyl-CoA transferase
MWGSDGPRATWPGFDQLAQASCGLEQELGGEGNGPNWYRFGMCDQACAVQSALAVLMALYWRERTGEGQLVDTSIVNGGVFLNTDAWIGPDGWSKRPRTDARQTGLGPLYRLYEASDGWLAIACLGGTHRRALVSVVPGLDPAAPDVGTLEAWFAARSAQEAFAVLDAAGVPVELAPEDARRTWFTQPDLVAAGLVADYQHPTYGRFRQFGSLVDLSDTPGRIAGPPPLLGQHSREVLADLGYTGAEIESLRDRGVTLWPD